MWLTYIILSIVAAGALTKYVALGFTGWATLIAFWSCGFLSGFLFRRGE